MANDIYNIFIIDTMLFEMQSKYVHVTSDHSTSLALPLLMDNSFFSMGYTHFDDDLVYLCGSPYNVANITPIMYPVPGNFLGTIVLASNSHDISVWNWNRTKDYLHQYLEGQHFPLAIVLMGVDYARKAIDANTLRAFLELDIPIFEIDTLTKEDARKSLEQCYQYFKSQLDAKPNPERDKYLNSEKILTTAELYKEGRNYHWILNITTYHKTDSQVFKALSDKYCWHMRDDTQLLHWYGYRDVNEDLRIYITNGTNFGHRDTIKETVEGMLESVKGKPPPPPKTHLQIDEFIKQAGVIGYIGRFNSQKSWREQESIDDYEMLRVQNMIEEFGNSPFVLIDQNSDSNIKEIRKRLNLADEIPLLAGVNAANLQQLYPLLEKEIQRKQSK